MGQHVPVWDIHDKFGDTNLLVTSVAQGDDLAATLGRNKVALMRGHGFAAAGASLLDVVRIGVYLPQNARVHLNALRLGPVTPLSDGEIRMRTDVNPVAPDYARAWEYWLDRAGVTL